MREEGNPPPVFEADQVRVVCTLPAHPRHAALRNLRSAEQALALGDLDRARARVEVVLGNDPLNFRAIQLFAEVHLARGARTSSTAHVSAVLKSGTARPGSR